MSHNISNILTQLRNSSALGKKACRVPWSGYTERFLAALAAAGYIGERTVIEQQPRSVIEIALLPGRLHEATVISTPGRRQYVGSRQIPIVKNGLGEVIISTSHGLMTGKQAKEKGVGGELICRLA